MKPTITSFTRSQIRIPNTLKSENIEYMTSWKNENYYNDGNQFARPFSHNVHVLLFPLGKDSVAFFFYYYSFFANEVDNKFPVTIKIASGKIFHIMLLFKYVHMSVSFTTVVFYIQSPNSGQLERCLFTKYI